VLQQETWATLYHLDSIQSYYRVLGGTLMTICVIPFFLVMNFILMDVLDHSNVLVKYSHLRTWWHAKWVGTAQFALLVAASINLGLLSSTLFSRSHAEVDATWLLTALLAVTIQSLVLIAVGTLHHVISLWLGRPHVGLILVVGLCFLAHSSKLLLKYPWPTPDEWMALSGLYPLRNSTAGVATALTALAAVCVVTWLAGRRLATRRDFLRPDAS
jgi:hypothetical protein